MYKKILAISLLAIGSNTAIAQKKESRDIQVDSLTFVNNRKLINSLNTTLFTKEIFKKGNVEIPYRMLKPKNNNKNEKYPLIITFHNSSRIGKDNEEQLEPLAKIWLKTDIQNNYPCYVIAPQFDKRSSNYSQNNDGILISKPSNDVRAVLMLLKKIEKEYSNIDTNRIYLIGYSMGGSTAQNLLHIAPKKFAAMISIAAVPDFSNIDKIKHKNIWLIHGEKDNENPYSGSVALFTKLASNKNLTFTTLTHLDHNKIVIPFLTTDEIPKWLFGKSK